MLYIYLEGASTRSFEISSKPINILYTNIETPPSPIIRFHLFHFIMRPQIILPIILSLVSFPSTTSAYYRDSAARAAVAEAEATANAPYSDQQDWSLFVPRASGQSTGGGGGGAEGASSGLPGGKPSTAGSKSATGPTSKGGGSTGSGGGSGGGFGDLQQFMNQETARLKKAAVAAGKKPDSIYHGCGALSGACG